MTIIHESFNTFNDGYFQVQLYSNTILAILPKIMAMNTHTFKINPKKVVETVSFVPSQVTSFLKVSFKFLRLFKKYKHFP